jgi:hypothetical protein
MASIRSRSARKLTANPHRSMTSWDNALVARIGIIASEQNVSVPVAGPDGTNTLLTITTGFMSCSLSATAPSVLPIGETYSALLSSPVLQPGQFRRAIATASIAGIQYAQEAAAANTARWLVSKATAQLDDETGRIELAVDLVAEGSGANTQLVSVGFQVTTTAVTP